MLSNFYNQIFVVYKWFGSILALQISQVIFWNNVQINAFF